MPLSTPPSHDPSSPSDPAERPGLTRQRIVTAALALIDEEGLDALTMRRLGSRLGVEAMAIYKHLPNKQAVLDGVIGLMLEELNAGDPPPSSWRGALSTLAFRHRAIEQRHPAAYRLFQGMPGNAYRTARATVTDTLSTLTGAGFSTHDAQRALRVVLRYSIGFTLTRPSAVVSVNPDDPLAEILRHLTNPQEEEALFALGLSSLLDGLGRSLLIEEHDGKGLPS